MKRNYVAVTMMVIILTGCYVNPSTHEKTGPDVVFRQGDSNIDDLFLNPDTSTPAKFGPASIACVATDPGGVKSISLSYSDTVKVCVTSGTCGFSGLCFGNGGPISPVLTYQSASSHPDYAGQVPNELFVLSDLKKEAYECSYSGDGKTVRGTPYGQTIKATCSATNYSGKTSTATLPVTFNAPSGVTWCCTGGSCNCGGESSSSKVNVCCAGHVCQSDGACKSVK